MVSAPKQNIKALVRRELKSESSTFDQTSYLVNQTHQKSLDRESTGVEFFNNVDPCSLLASNDDPHVDQQLGIEGLDWTQMDKSLFANCTRKSTTITSISCDSSDYSMGTSNSTFDTVTVPVMFVYEVETANVSSTSSFLPILEENILMKLGKKCEMFEMYGILGMHSTPEDVEMKNGPCSFESTLADNCFIMEGVVTLDVLSSFNTTWAEDQAHSVIKGSMDNDELLNSTTIPEIIKVNYKHDDTFDNYMGGFTHQDGGIVVAPEKNQSSYSAIFASLVGLVCMTMLTLLLLHKKHKRAHAREEEIRRLQAARAREMEAYLEDDLDGLVADIDGATAKSISDFEGHFHLGKHHFTADGVRYWSPTCAFCIAAKASTKDLKAGKNKRDDDELSYDLNAMKKFTDSNIHDLGKHHSSMHVRECKSKICQGCSNDINSVVFIQSTKQSSRRKADKNTFESIML